MKRVATKRESNKAVIMELVQRLGPLSRVKIHQLTQFRPSTISLLTRELLREDKLQETGISDNPMGRKAIQLRVNPEYGYVVGMEFDDRTVIAATLDLQSRIKSLIKEPTRLDGGVDELVRQLLSCARKAMRKAGIDMKAVLGIAVADPGLVDSHQGVSVFCSIIDFWKQVPLKGIFEEEFRVPFLLESGPRARTLAERVLGAGRMTENMIYVDYVGTGIGAGIITEGKIFRGHREGAGELGHTHVIANGPPCRCGSFGCLEAIAGTPALASRARSAVLEGSGSQVLELAKGDPEKITGWMVFQAAKLGDKMCSAIIEEMEKYLGLAIANLVNLFNPSVVVLDQRLEVPGLLDQVNRIVKRQALAHLTEGLAIRFSTLGSEAGILGAGLLVMEKLFEIPALRPPQVL